MEYKFCGKSGLKLPVLSLGLWHNFGAIDDFANSRQMICTAFDKGITHIDLANNYGPPPGSAEETFGKVLKSDLASHRDELIVSSKAGHLMWNGPYGDGSSRKSLFASIDQSLKRTGLDYFDIFYSHRYDGETPVEETMMALVDIVRQGKALYVGLSKYPYEKAKEAFSILKENKVPCLIYQDRYNMLVRDVEKGLLQLTEEQGSGFIAFSPLAQGLLTDKYLHGIPQGSRAAKESGFLQQDQVNEPVIAKATRLNEIARQRGQSLAEMALAWVLYNKRVTSVIIGVSSVGQLNDNIDTLNNKNFSTQEIDLIEDILNQ
ncbi:aldo/keto reductase [Dysgonomonas macrotermitis]|uniref:L-glyceraldehyde 3-phosphate reductase n=1 Tax=Dysgonomonas macrotermitis TaxID=1346286 RepID=A0A1M5GKB0_9BACT|nr:aldo/keto reductase [Dysgonomonas macrotermitis]SHG04126.1 L-glyceraldehyde 3-phosphate reductase [Dysgonomonas macrotermitis]